MTRTTQSLLALASLSIAFAVAFQTPALPGGQESRSGPGSESTTTESVTSRSDTTDEAARKLAEAQDALRAAGLHDEASRLDEVIDEVSSNNSKDRESKSDGSDEEDERRARGWRWSRSDKEGDKEGKKVSSEISELFRSMFEITRGVEEHETRIRELSQRYQDLASPERAPRDGTRMDAVAARNRETRRAEYARLLVQVQQERATALERLRERTPRMREAIDRAMGTLENQRPNDLGRRTQAIHDRLRELRDALEYSDRDDDQFYTALREFVEKSRLRRHHPDKPEPPGERATRVQREIEVLRDRLGELEVELRRLRQAALPPPPPLHAPGSMPSRGQLPPPHAPQP